MRVELHGEVFLNSKHLEEIHALLREFRNGRHEWLIRPQDIERLSAFFQEHAGTLAGTYSAFARKASVASHAWSGTSTPRPVVRVSEATIRDDTHDLQRPAYLAVEDGVSDRCFLLAMAHVFDGSDIVMAVEKGWLELVHGGGSDRAKQNAEHKYDSFKRTPRVALLLDSDRCIPGQPSKHQQKAHQLRDRGIHVHILELREIENYVPNRVLLAWSRPRAHREIANRIDALKQLTPEQRGYFDMKNGLPGNRGDRESIRQKHGDLYNNVPDSTIELLRKGFSTDSADDLVERMRREAEMGKLSVADFEGLGDRVAAEMRELLAMLRKII